MRRTHKYSVVIISSRFTTRVSSIVSQALPVFETLNGLYRFCIYPNRTAVMGNFFIIYRVMTKIHIFHFHHWSNKVHWARASPITSSRRQLRAYLRRSWTLPRDPSLALRISNGAEVIRLMRPSLNRPFFLFPTIRNTPLRAFCSLPRGRVHLPPALSMYFTHFCRT